jgi:hypothetical protein
MKLRLLTIVLFLCATLPASAEVFSARSAAMGGTGVASSEFDAAAGSNGALLTRFDETDDIALILPFVGAEISDKDEVIDTLDDVVDLYDDLEFNINNGNNTNALENALDITNKLSDISGEPLRVNAAVLIGVAIPSKTLGIAFDIRSSAEGGVIAEYAETDALVLAAAILADDASLLDLTRSSGVALGAAVTEVTMTLATEFSTGEKSTLAVSVTPKYQRVDTVLYAFTVQDFESNDIYDNSNNSANFNFDVGLAYSAGEHWVLGFRARNLISEDYDTETIELGDPARFTDRTFSGTYQIEPTAVAGVAYNLNWFTATIEGDLVKVKGFKRLDETQFVRAGAEFNIAQWVQFRAGYRYDIEDVRANVYTAGLGFSPWDVFHFDIAATYGEDDTYGAALDLRWTL